MLSPPQIPSPRTRRFTPEFITLCCICAAYIAWLLSMPVFPTQDGPVHLYYTRILAALLSHTPTPYSQYFTIKHLLPPYALYYYLLLVLSKVVPPLLADRLIICLYVLSFIFGFRYLATTIGPNGERTTLLATVLVLNWPLGEGFVNFCLSISLALIALGLWHRFSDSGIQDTLKRRIGFILLAFTMMLTHPIPLLLALAFAAFDLGIRFLRRHRSAEPSTQLRADALTWLIAATTLGYVKLFTSSHLLVQLKPETGSLAYRVTLHTAEYALQRGVSFLTGTYAEVRLTHICLYVIFITGFAVAWKQFHRNRAQDQWTRSNTWFLFSLFAVIALPFLPHDLNGSHYFSDRLLFPVWFLPLLAASGWTSPGGDKQRPPVASLAIVFAVAANAIAIYAAEVHIRPFANQIMAVIHGPQDAAIAPGKLGLLLDDSSANSWGDGATWWPLLYAGTHVFRAHDAILGNAPWLYLPIMPIEGTQALPITHFALPDADAGQFFTTHLEQSPQFRDQELSAPDFLLIRRAPLNSPPLLAGLLQSQNTPHGWSCTHNTDSWFWICNRK